jgi:hypothetical protein
VGQQLLRADAAVTAPAVHAVGLMRFADVDSYAHRQSQSCQVSACAAQLLAVFLWQRLLLQLVRLQGYGRKTVASVKMFVECT